MVLAIENRPYGAFFTQNFDLLRLGKSLPTVGSHIYHPTARTGSAEILPYVLTVGASNEGKLNKSYVMGEDGIWRKAASSPNVFSWSYSEVVLRTPEDVFELISLLERNPRLCLIRAAMHPDASLCVPHFRRWHKDYRKSNDEKSGSLIDLARYWVIIDIDTVPVPPGTSYDEPEKLIARVVGEVLPEPFRNASCVWQLSGSAGLRTSTGPDSADQVVKVHLFFKAAKPICCRDLHGILAARLFDVIDRSCAVGTQILYTASPSLEGGSDPLPRRCGIHRAQRDEVDLDPYLTPAEETEPPRGKPPNVHGSAPSTLKRPTDVLPYEHAWLRIAYNRLGVHAGGYRSPIFSMISAAIRNGETDFCKLKTELRVLVLARLHELGDIQKRQDVARYLSDKELDDAIASSVNYWFGDDAS